MLVEIQVQSVFISQIVVCSIDVSKPLFQITRILHRFL